MADATAAPQQEPRKKFGFKEATVALGVIGAIVAPEAAAAQNYSPLFAQPGVDYGCDPSGVLQQRLSRGEQVMSALQQRAQITRTPPDPNWAVQIQLNQQAAALSQNDCQLQQGQGGGFGGYSGGGVVIPGIPGIVIPIPIPGGGGWNGGGNGNNGQWREQQRQEQLRLEQQQEQLRQQQQRGNGFQPPIQPYAVTPQGGWVQRQANPQAAPRNEQRPAAAAAAPPHVEQHQAAATPQKRTR